MKKHNKTCGVCGRRMQRHGVTSAGRERYFCATCKKAVVVDRKDTRLRHTKDRLVTWLTGVENKQTLANRLGVTRRTLSNEFKAFFLENPDQKPPHGFRAKILTVDAKFIHGSVLCVLVALTEKDELFWQFATGENNATWTSFLEGFAPPDVVVADGQKGMALFVKTHWPTTRFQRCHFHMVALVIHYLSRHPEEKAELQILDLMYRLKRVKTHDDKQQWLMFRTIWEKQYEKLFAEKNANGGYRYRKLRAVRLILRRALPDLFTYLDIPGCPNTTNAVEGWVNTAIAEGLRRHRGLHLNQKKTLVSIILSHLKRKKKEKPTRTFSENHTPIFP